MLFSIDAVKPFIAVVCSELIYRNFNQLRYQSTQSAGHVDIALRAVGPHMQQASIVLQIIAIIDHMSSHALQDAVTLIL